MKATKKPKAPRSYGVFWAVVDENGRRPMPCLAGPRKRDAEQLRSDGERVVRVVVTEYQS